MGAVQLAISASGGSHPVSPAFVGDHAWCNEKMMLAADLVDGIPLPVFFAEGAFGLALDRYQAESRGTDRRAVVSMWSLYYFAALATPCVLARNISGQILPVGFDRMTIALQDNGLPRAFGLADRGSISNGAAREFESVSPLIEDHIVHAVPHLKACGISAKLCWNNAAVYVDYALRLTGVQPETDAQSDLSLFTRGCLPDGGANPFCGCVKHVVEGGEIVKRRKLCCLRYLLPGVPSCGNLCALPNQRKHQ